MDLTPIKNIEMKILVKLLIVRYHFIIITLLKPYLVCTFFDKQIDLRKCERKFGSVRILMVG